jgi:two-component system, chemotaxis family, CheB/CheR fusion protein
VTSQDLRAPAAVPVVGIGASAGGIEALQRFFAAVPEDLGLAYVVILHLAPDHESELPGILRRHTRMPVSQVGDHDEIELAANHVYVIAPNRKLEITDGAVSASAFEAPRGQWSAIDVFFRSLARSHGDGFAVVLSGSGADGASGARAIKEAGGVVLVQEPTEAAHDGMPRAVIATGAADVVLPVQELVKSLAELARCKPQVSQLLRPFGEEPRIEEDDNVALSRVLELLKQRTGHDFSKYKQTTVARRLVRRMQLSQCARIDDYLTYLRENADESRKLLADLLITVTTFFRDPEAWTALAETVIGPLVERVGSEQQLRAWVAGCATGEEAYTLAILFEEESARRQIRSNFTIFASDIDPDALAVARDGVFPRAIASDLSDARLERFFTAEDDHYRIAPEIRERVVFASHSLLRDPPFSRLHLVSCRNLLIYLDRELQAQVTSVFRYSCRNDGYLILGPAESVDSDLFVPIDKKHSIFAVAQLADGARPPLPDILTAAHGRRHSHELERRPNGRQSSAEAHVDALEAVAPPSLIVDEHYNVLHLSAQAARFLQQGAGPLARRLTDLVRAELRDELHARLHRAFERSEPELSRFIDVTFDGTPHRVAVLVQRRPCKQGMPPQALVTFLDGGVVRHEAGSSEETTTGLVSSLREELRRSERRAERMHDDHILTNEDLRAANEELQSINEEYRSTTEELETSKEELHSLNEELQTLNHELKAKLEEVSHARADVENVIAATEVGILFLDRNLCIKRFTPRIGEYFSIKARDHDRPIGDVTHSLDYMTLEADARRVLAEGKTIEREATSREGRWFMVRLAPYKVGQITALEGVVITFVDVTALKRAESALRRSESQLANELKMLRRLHDMTLVAATASKLQVALDEILQTAIELHGADFGNIQLLDRDRQKLRILSQRGLGEAFLKAFESVGPEEESACARAFRSRSTCRIEDVFRDPKYAPYREIASGAGYRSVQAIPLIDRNEVLVGVLSTHFRDVHAFSDRDRQLGDLLARQAADLIARRTQQEDLARLNAELSQANDELAAQARNKEGFLAVLGHELRNPMAAISNSLELVTPGDGRTERAVGIMRRQSQHMIRLVNDLLDVTRINHGKLELERAVIDAAQCVRDAAESIRSLVGAKGLELSLDIPSEPVPVNADPARIAQVLDNLLRNAVGYTEHGRITVTLRKQEGHASFSVCDTGMGVDPAIAERLFDPFNQTELGRRAGGLGLGLALVKRLVEMHGGVVSLHSEGPGHGSEFSFTLPLAESMPAVWTGATSTKLRARRILVVDDQADNAEMFAALLESLGQDVRAAYGARAALEIAREYRPEIAFLDLSMPEIGGRELARLLRRDFPTDELTLIALTGFAKDHPDARDSEFARHVLKPATMAAVVELLASLDMSPRPQG